VVVSGGNAGDSGEKSTPAHSEHLHGGRAICAGGSITELARIIIAPGVNGALARQSDSVVISTRYLNEVNALNSDSRSASGRPRIKSRHSLGRQWCRNHPNGGSQRNESENCGTNK
jgi:hypothetical protein